MWENSEISNISDSHYIDTQQDLFDSPAKSNTCFSQQSTQPPSDPSSSDSSCPPSPVFGKRLRLLQPQIVMTGFPGSGSI
ncbi:hypothetical protein DPMN_190972 [Dreissena polymorpha]|uniref:Uncharacterized protein n=1 Tax=Dreissena polymorpha TaxID=45954 RepID=A0A9D4B713_DREPO|nr:hypothetical protein DPMN_190972 [Dreissena polymorpha]